MFSCKHFNTLIGRWVRVRFLLGQKIERQVSTYSFFFTAFSDKGGELNWVGCIMLTAENKYNMYQNIHIGLEPVQNYYKYSDFPF